MAHYGVPASIEDNNLNNIEQALKSKKGVVADVDENSLLHQDYLGIGRHSVLVTGIEKDDKGNVTYVIVNDTGIKNGCSTIIPVDDWNKAVTSFNSGGTGNAAKLVVTDGPIY
jgi:hypothetical protein